MKKPTLNELKKELRSLVAEIAEVEQDKVTDDARFVEDLGMDSMMALEILAAIEERYRIQIPEDILPKLTSLKEAVRLTGRIIKNHKL